MSTQSQNTRTLTYGGSWFDTSFYMRPAYRYDVNPISHHNDTSFRIALRRIA